MKNYLPETTAASPTKRISPDIPAGKFAPLSSHFYRSKITFIRPNKHHTIMRTKNLLALFALLLISFYSTAQTQFWSDDFEDSGSPSVGSRTPSIAEFNCTTGSGPNKGYFKRTDGSDLVSDGAFTSLQGTKFWAFMNLDIGTSCTSNSIVAAQTITWPGINISGKSGLSFKGLFGQNTSAAFQGVSFGADQDFMVMEYRIDGGPWTKIVGLYSNNSVGGNGGPLAVDNNGDLIGDGTVMTYAMTELSASITGTGNTLDLRFDIFANNGSPGSMAIDNFGLFSTPPCNMTASLTSQNNVSCNGGSNGAATVAAANGTGTLTYNWTPGNPSGDGTASVTGLTAQSYTCTITDTIGCTATQTVNITQPPAITSSVTAQNVSCFNGNNGAATVTASGGTGTLTYDWTPGNPTGDGTTSVTGLTAQLYTCTITDANGCTATKTVTISQPASAVSGSTSVTNVSCNGGNDGSINLTPSGGTGPYTFNWGSSITTEDRTGLAAGNYSVIITDVNGCTGTVNETITQPAAITSSVTSQTNVACNGGSTGAATISASGGTGAKTYSWSPSGVTAATATGLSAGTYTVTITDANTCTKEQTVTITEPTPVTMMNNTATVNQTSGNLASYNADCENLIARVLSNGTAPIAGSTTAKVWIDATQNTQFVKRHYEITPVDNPGSATGKVTLYFTQQNFTDFNSQTPTPAKLLPVDAVTLISFTGKSSSEGNLLQWKTANESNFSGFEVQRAGDAKKLEFQSMDFVKGNSRGTYQYTHTTPTSGINYYRLKMVDLDGSFAYSRTISIAGNDVPDLTISPNPATDVFFIDIPDEQLIGSESSIYSTNGMIVAKIKITARKQPVDVSQWSGGLYLVRFANGKTYKLVKM